MKETLGRCYKYYVYDNDKSCDIHCYRTGDWIGTIYKGNPDWTVTYANGIKYLPINSALRLLGYEQNQKSEIE